MYRKKKIYIRKNGIGSIRETLLFPGYVFIDTDYSDALYYKVKSVHGILRFLGDPTPVSLDDENFLRLLFNNGEIIPESFAQITSDGKILIKSGFLKGKEKYISSINARQHRAYVTVNFGGKQHRTSLYVEYTRN